MLTLRNLTAKIDRKIILDGVTQTFRKKKIYAIMGPNGSGKSTLARIVMGDPTFSLTRTSELKLSGKSIKNKDADERAHLGIFLSMQSPLAIPGVTVFSLLRAATQETGITAKELKTKMDQYASDLKIPAELLTRSLNDGFSGGERKKMEVLQMAVLNPQYIFLDEIDTGVDVDALKTIAQFLKKHLKETDKTLVMITHYNRILKYLTPDVTLIIKDGAIVKRGDAELAKMIEKKGFDSI